MKVSIITATYNSASTLEDTLHSVAQQSYPSIQHVIVDGGSSDDTLKIAESFPHVARIDSKKDKGLYDAMNRGIGMVDGDVIAILNSDDVYDSSQIIEDVVNHLETSGSETLYGDLQYVREDDLNKVVRNWRSGPFQENSFLKGWMPPHPTFFVRREVYERYGSFRLDMGSAADYEIMLRFLFKNKVSTTYLAKVLVRMREGGVSNASLRHRLRANKMDRKAWDVNDLNPRWYTLMAKPLRKLEQWL